tara:strand:- start:421 stop:723 length:303 start_codon:yes stop_codon:yes gene_type:complete
MSLIRTKTIGYVISVIFFIVAIAVFYAFIHLIPLENHNPIVPYCDFCKEHLPYKKKGYLLYDCSECGKQMVTSLLNFLLGLILCAPFMFLSCLFYGVFKK